jgi:predicted MFS family arabinose efflux permease
LPSVFVLQKIIISVELNDFESNGIKADFIDCIKFIKQDKVILGLILTVTAISLFCLPFAQFLPIFADRVFHMGSKALGYLMTSIGIGALIASLIIASAREIFNKRVYMTISGLLFPLTIIVFTLTTNIIAAVCLLVCTGAFTLCMMALTNSFIQIRVADAIRGRVMSVYIMMVLGIMPIGYLLMGYMSDILGTKNAIMINCSLCMVSFIGLRVLWRKG